MITPAYRSTVSTTSLAAALIAILALGACARGASLATMNDAIARTERPLAIRFDNEAQTYVDVYLIGEQREWRLGRVAPGARATLTIPEGAISASSGLVRLGVLANLPYSAQAARDPRTTFTIAQPVSQLLAQRWAFWQRHSAPAEIFGAR